MRALVTRPLPEAEALARKLEARGIEAMIEPMLEIHFRGEAHGLDLEGVRALLVTSANGVRALARATVRREVPVFAVGEASARAAREAGFRSVESARGDAPALVELVARRLKPAGGRLLHASGAHLARDLAGPLRAKGFEVRRQVLYETRPARAFSPGLAKAFQEGAIDFVLFFSPRSASTFASLVRKADLAGGLRRVDAFFLSPAVAEAAGALAWRGVWIAPRPEEEALLEELERARSFRKRTSGLEHHGGASRGRR